MAAMGPGRGRYWAATVDEVLRYAAAQVDSAFRNQPELAAVMHATIGEIYESLTQYEAAEPHLLRRPGDPPQDPGGGAPRHAPGDGVAGQVMQLRPGATSRGPTPGPHRPGGAAPRARTTPRRWIRWPRSLLCCSTRAVERRPNRWPSRPASTSRRVLGEDAMTWTGRNWLDVILSRRRSPEQRELNEVEGKAQRRHGGPCSPTLTQRISSPALTSSD